MTKMLPRIVVAISLVAFASAHLAAQAGEPAKPVSASANSSTKASAQTGQAKADANSANKASAQAGKSNAELKSDSAFEAVLSKPLDAKKCKPGDVVEAKANKDVKSDSEVVIPKGSKLLGHVTESKARAKGESESRLGMVFDKAVLKDGREVPLNVVVQAVALSESAAALQTPSPMAAEPIGGSGRASGRSSASGTASGGGGLVGGVTSTAGGAVGTATGAAGGATGTLGQTTGATLGTATSAVGSAGGGGGSLTGALTSNSSGVIGLQGLNLVSESAGNAQGSVLSSTTQNVKLDSGTRLLLRVVKP